jgi:hypothetical protein
MLDPAMPTAPIRQLQRPGGDKYLGLNDLPVMSGKAGTDMGVGTTPTKTRVPVGFRSGRYSATGSSGGSS